MTSSKMREAALTARDAHLALLELKQLVDSATKNLHSAELEIVGAAIAQTQAHDPLKNLRAVAESLHSPAFEAAISHARAKMKNAVARHAPAGMAAAAGKG
jgi:chaperone required for assembly of F1-ATPase